MQLLALPWGDSPISLPKGNTARQPLRNSSLRAAWCHVQYRGPLQGKEEKLSLLLELLSLR